MQYVCLLLPALPTRRSNGAGTSVKALEAIERLGNQGAPSQAWKKWKTVVALAVWRLQNVSREAVACEGGFRPYRASFAAVSISTMSTTFPFLLIAHSSKRQPRSSLQNCTHKILLRASNCHGRVTRGDAAPPAHPTATRLNRAGISAKAPEQPALLRE